MWLEGLIKMLATIVTGISHLLQFAHTFADFGSSMYSQTSSQSITHFQTKFEYHIIQFWLSDWLEKTQGNDESSLKCRTRARMKKY